MRKFSLILALTLSFSTYAFAETVPYGQELKDMPKSAYDLKFTDVAKGHWAYNYIGDIVAKKIMDGFPDNKFRPDDTITRAQFATMIVRAAGLKAAAVNKTSFSDISTSDWYAPFVEAAKDYLTGYQTSGAKYIYNPDAPAIREDIAIAIVKIKGYDKRLPNESMLESMFNDSESISSSARRYVALAIENKLVSGYDDGTFKAQNSITRAEAAALLWRAFQYGNDNKGVGGADPSSPVNIGSPSAPAIPPSADSGSTSAADGSTTPLIKTAMTVQTLVGGLGQGDTDGSQAVAKIYDLQNMTMDAQDNIYFLDNNKIRKFNKADGMTSTVKTIDQEFGYAYFDKDNSFIKFEARNFKPKIVHYDIPSAKLFVGGFHRSQNGVDMAQIFQIQPTVSLAVYNTGSPGYDSFNFLRYHNGKLIYGYYYDIYSGNVQTPATAVQKMASSFDGTGPAVGGYNNMTAILMQDDNTMYMLDSYHQQLYKMTIFPRKVEKVSEFKGIYRGSSTVYNGKFYTTSDNTIYEVNLDGSFREFMYGPNLKYNGEKQLNKIDAIIFDRAGNPIVYDSENKAIRRINIQ